MIRNVVGTHAPYSIKTHAAQRYLHTEYCQKIINTMENNVGPDSDRSCQINISQSSVDWKIKLQALAWCIGFHGAYDFMVHSISWCL